MTTSPQPRRSSYAGKDLDLRPLLGVNDVAEILGVPKATLYRWHSLSDADHPVGPRAFRVGKHLRYTLEDLRDYIESQRRAARPWGA